MFAVFSRALHQDQPEENVNGRRGVLRRKTPSESGNQSPDGRLKKTLSTGLFKNKIYSSWTLPQSPAFR